MGVRRLVLLLLLVLAGCRKSDERAFTTGEALLDQQFEQSFGWEPYTDERIGAHLRIEDGAYRITLMTQAYVWGLNAQDYDNVALETQSSQLSDDDNNAYGVICRGEPSNNGGGYYFLISGDGFWSIRRGSANGAQPLIEFTASPWIHQGRSLNTIRALCIDNYLALYVNDHYLGSTYDSTITHGAAGLVAAVTKSSSVDVSFDYVRIVKAALTPEQ